MNITVIYEGENACKKCLGWKRVASESGESWKYWEELPTLSRIAVDMGLVRPMVCPRCNGTGIEPKMKNRLLPS